MCWHQISWKLFRGLMMSSDLNRICPILLDWIRAWSRGLERSDKVLRGSITPQGIYNWQNIFILLCSITYHILLWDFSFPQCEPDSCLQFICIFKCHTHTHTQQHTWGQKRSFWHNNDIFIQSNHSFQVSLRIDIIITSFLNLDFVLREINDAMFVTIIHI